MSRYVISDLHLNHENIIKLCDRPFEDSKEMNETIIKNILSINYKPEDTIFFLGDMGFLPKEEFSEFLSKINAKKYLILGNHDKRKPVGFWKEIGFLEVSKFPICVSRFYWLSHEPMYLNASMPYVNIHGHTHNTDMIMMIGDKNMYYNVSVEKINYTPVKLEDIIKDYNKNESSL